MAEHGVGDKFGRDGAGSNPGYADGEPYKPTDLAMIEPTLEDLIPFLRKHHGVDPSMLRKEKGKILDATT